MTPLSIGKPTGGGIGGGGSGAAEHKLQTIKPAKIKNNLIGTMLIICKSKK